MTSDVVIIGSGLGGLTCASILSRAGMSVVVLEQHSQVGGCLQSFRREGEDYDTGFHYVGGLGEGQSLHAAFSYLGLMRLPWQKLDADGFDRVVLGGHTYAYAEGFDAFARRMSDYFPSERTALHRYAELLRRTVRSQLLSLDPRGADDTAEGGTLMSANAWKYLQETFRDSTLIDVLSGTSLKMELRKESLPLFSFLHSQSSYIESSWRLSGHGSLLSKTLVANLEAQGGTVRCGRKVVRLDVRQGRVAQAVCADGETYDARWFVSDLSPQSTVELLAPSSAVRPAYRRRVCSYADTMGMFTLSLRLKPSLLPYFNYNLYVYEDNDLWSLPDHNSPVRGLLITCRPPADGDYTTHVDLLTPMPWSRCSQWQDTTIGKRGSAYADMKRRVADECLALACRHVPQLSEAEKGYTSTPLTWRDYTLTRHGSAYGVRKDCRTPWAVALSPRTPVPNLLATGQNLVLHGLHGVTMTAFHTCAAVLGKERIWDILHYKTV